MTRPIGGDAARGARRRLFASVGHSRSVLAALALLAVAAPVSGQVRIGGHGVYRNDDLLMSGFGAGARAEFDLDFIMPQLVLGGVYNRFFPDCPDCRSWEAGGQVALGEGLGYIGLSAILSRMEGYRTTPNDDWKFSVVVGFRLPGLPLALPFLEVRQSVGSGPFNDQAISLGILIGPARARRAPRRPPPR